MRSNSRIPDAEQPPNDEYWWVTPWCRELSVRASCGLANLGLKNRAEVLDFVKKGGAKALSGCPNLGKKSIKEIMDWLGTETSSWLGSPVENLLKDYELGEVSAEETLRKVVEKLRTQGE